MDFKVAHEVYPRVYTKCSGGGLTKQSFRDECDINNILRKYQKTGLIEHVKRFNGQYGDFSDVKGYQDSLNRIKAADEAFMSLPVDLRKRFHQRPAEFLEFVSNSVNRDEMLKMGLLKPKVDEASPKVQESVEKVDSVE